jgi:amino acid adenylation domain-containing protein
MAGDGASSCLHELFEAQAARDPDAIALSFEGTTWTYGELDRRTNQLARFLRARGVGPETFVALRLERSLELVAAVVAVLKAGGAYVPIDPVYPAERVAYMLADARPRLVLAQAPWRPDAFDGEVIYLDRDWPRIAVESAAPLPRVSSPQHLAYVIYTSGSTGKPKGVQITHDNVLRLMSQTAAWYRFDARDVWPLFHSFAFDVSVWEMWCSLGNGGRLVVVPRAATRDHVALRALLARERVTVFNQTPSSFYQFILADELAGDGPPLALRCVIFAGEALNLRALAPWYARHPDAPRLVNMYGITETTVHSSYRELTAEDARSAVGSLIGVPIPDLRLYVLDEALQPAPVGELYVAGPGLARGYLSRPALTAERYLPDPFGAPGERMYRSGDLARRLDDGSLEYLGRIDLQVKIRGYRVELGEIESALLAHPQVRGAVVVLRELASGPALVAYVQPAAAATAPDAAALREFLGPTLPEYMVPAAFVTLSAFPLTANGKIDRAALPAPSFAHADASGDPPRTATEQTIATIWSELLGVARIGRDANFFALGGHSLLALRVVAKLRAALGRDLTPGALFAAPTVRQLAQVLDARGRTIARAAPRAHADGDLVMLTASQRAIWVHDRHEPGLYNLLGQIELRGSLDRDRLARALVAVARRHEALRTVFVEHDGVPSGRLVAAPDVLAVAPGTGAGELARVCDAERDHRFEAGAPAWRCTLVALAADHHVLVGNFHHLVWDALSQGVFVQELAACYGDAELPAVSIQPADLAERERSLLADEQHRRALLDYWRVTLAGVTAPIDVRVDRPRPTTRTHRAGTARFALPAPLVAQLRAICAAAHTTLYSGLVGLFQLLLARHAEQDDVVVGAAVSVRDDERAEAAIGCLIDPVPLRLQLHGDPPLSELLRRAGEMVGGALAHCRLPLSEIVRELAHARDHRRLPLYEITFNVYAETASAAGGGLTLAWQDVAGARTPFDLSVGMIEAADGELRGTIVYDLDLFDDAWIDAFARRYRALVADAVEHPDAPISQLARGIAHELAAELVAPVLGLSLEQVHELARFTPTQRDLYLGYARQPELRRYLAHSLELGTVDAACWQRAIALVTEHCALLRCRVASCAGRLYQVACAGAPEVELVQVASVEAFVHATAKAVYDIEHDPLVRHWLVRDPQGRDVAVLAWSHVLFDARSAALLFQRIGEVYAQLARGESPAPAGAASFLDLTPEIAASFDTPAALARWREELAGVSPLEPLEAPGATAGTCSYRAVLEGEARSLSRALCRELAVGEAALFRALVAACLDGIFAGTDDFVLYEVRGGRGRDHGDVLGSFHTVLPRVVSRAAVGESFAALLAQQRALQDRCRAHPLSVSAQRRLLDDTFQIYFNFYDFVEVDAPGGPAVLATYDSYPEREAHVVVEASAARIVLSFHTDERVAGDPRLLERVLLLLSRLCAGERDVSGELVLPDELPIVQALNAHACEFPYVESVVDVFERQAAARADAVAIRCERRDLGYSELNARANQLAHHLRARGLDREARVAICLERGLELPIAILGTLKAGCAYVPIDLDVPRERVRHILDDSGVAVLLTSTACDPGAPGIARILVDELDLSREPATDPRLPIAASDAAYVIYTSGSTGLPKGVVVEHGNLIRLFRATEHWYGFDADDVWTLFHSYAFDFSVWEMFGAWLYGGRLVIVPRSCARSAEQFYQLLVDEGVTVLNQTPSAFRQLVVVDERQRAELPDLRYVIFGGEALDFHALAPWFARHRRPRLVNMYGITETTVHVTYRPVEPAEARPGQRSFIGAPIPDLQLFVLDHRGRRVPPGIAGELHVAGAGVARGYHARPELTAARFVTGRFGRLYRSGDVGRFDAHGELEYLGRADLQVKVRGYRIELGEIEAALRTHPEVRDAVVIAGRDSIGGVRLIAYAVVTELPGPTPQALHEHLARTLSAYMIPSGFVNLERLPLTANGKLDARALPAPVGAVTIGSDEPRSEIERRVAEVFCEVLQLPRVGIHDDFFDLGGHSILALRLVDRLHGALHVRISLRTLFAGPTVARLAEVLGEGRPLAPHVERVIAPGAATELVASAWQHSLWQQQLRDPYNAFLTVDAGVVLHGPLDVGALADAVDCVVARQQALRMRFVERRGVLYARIVPPQRGALIVSDVVAESRGAAVEACTRLVAEPFDLVVGPAFRAGLVRFGPQSHVLGFAASHMVTDGSSIGVWFSELAAFYNALVTTGSAEQADLPPLPVQFADYVRAHRDLTGGAEGERQRGYWRTALRDVEVARLPGESTATERHALTFHAGTTVLATLDGELTRRMRELAAREGVTVYVVLCAAAAATLRESSGQDRFCLVTANSQRHWPDVEHLIGYFPNPVFIVADLREAVTWRDVIKRLAESAFAAHEHPDVPIAMEMPAAFTRFNLNYIDAKRLRARPLAGLAVERIELAMAGRTLRAYNDMILWQVEHADRIVLELFYRVDLFTPEIVQDFLERLRATLDAMTAAPWSSITSSASTRAG